MSCNEEKTEIADIKSGVSKGNVLGPVLYTTYADDTTMMVARKTASAASSILQNQLNLIQKWLNKWNIKVNADKSTHVTLNTEECPPVSLNGINIPNSNCVKYLGMHIDRRY